MKFKQLLESKAYPFSGAPVIAFLGDSVTHGAFECTDGGRGCTFDFAAVYHNRLRLMISQKYEWIPISILNAGVSGDTAEGGLARLERDVISRRPDLCVVCYGLNDVNGELETYRDSLRGIFEALKAAEIETLFLTPNMLNTRVGDAVLDELTPFSMMEPERGPTRRAVTAAPAPGEALGSRRRSGFGPPLCPWRPAAPLASPLPRPGCCVGSEMATYSRFPPGGQEKPGPTSDPPRVFRPLVVPAPWDRPPRRLLLLFSLLPASSYIAGY